MTQQNEDVVRKNKEAVLELYKAFAERGAGTGSPPAVPKIDVDCSSCRHGFAGSYRGTDGVREVVDKVDAMAGKTFEVNPDDVLANERHVVVFASHKGQIQGKPIDGKSVHIWEMNGGVPINMSTHKPPMSPKS
jgi:hypothetical protein